MSALISVRDFAKAVKKSRSVVLKLPEGTPDKSMLLMSEIAVVRLVSISVKMVMY